MSHKFNLQAIAAAVAAAAFNSDPGARSADHFIAAAQTLEDDIIRELSDVVIDNKHFDMSDFLSTAFVDVAGSSIARHYTDVKPAAQKSPAEAPGRVEIVDGKPLTPSESMTKRDMDARTREQLNNGMRQSSSQTTAPKSRNPTTATLQDGTAYHEKAKFRDAGKAAQRFTQSSNQPTYDWDEVNALAKSSSLAGNREGLFGRS